MSEIKVNKISPRAACGTVTLGDSGDSFTIPAGATITNSGTAVGFGATGSASWVTTVKTSGFTAVAGEGYFVNTTSGAISVNLPAGTAGAVVAFKDYANTFDTDNLTLVQNGSDKIGGSTNNAIISTEGAAVTLVFVDSTKGWLVTDDGLQSEASTNPFICATGGTITTSGNCKIHTFTGPGTFCVAKTASCAANNAVAYMVIAGGGGGGHCGVSGGGGGAGGFREGKNNPITPYTASPLVTCGHTITATAFPITVGAGGAQSAPGPAPNENPGSNSSFSTITSTGGGAGGGNSAGENGGSGGGGSGNAPTQPGGTGNTPPVSPPQGNNGGAGGNCPPTYNNTGGGGGATAVGATISGPPQGGGAGGAGATTSISGSPVGRAGGGGGSADNRGTSVAGGTATCGGGRGGDTSNAPAAGTANTGGGGGGMHGPASGSGPTGLGEAGGSGIVIIRYKFQ